MRAKTSPEHDGILATALRPIVQGGRRFWLIVAVLGAVVAAGIVAYALQLWGGLAVTGLNDSVFYGIYETDLVAFIGISYGGAVVSAILRLTRSSWRAPVTRLAEALALVALPVGALFPIIHLGRPDRLWEMVVTPNGTSPVIWDAVAIMTYLMATALFFYLPLIPDAAICRDYFGASIGPWRRKLYGVMAAGWLGLRAQRRLLSSAMGILAIIMIPLAISVHSVLAWAFSVTSREGWHSTIFAPYFVVAALFSGVAAVIIVVVAFRRAYRLEKYIGEKQIQYLGYLMVVLGLLYLYFTFSDILTQGYVGAESSIPLMEDLLARSYAPLFWFFVTGAGIIPIALVAIPGTRTIKGIVAAAGLVVGGMWIKRFLIIVPTLEQSLFGASPAGYAGSLVEALISLAALAAIPLVLMLLFRIVPIMSVYEMEEVAAVPEGKEPAVAVPVRPIEGGSEA